MDRRVFTAFAQEVATKLAADGHERMDAAKWKQTLIDVPLVAGVGGLGYGVGRTFGDMMGESMARKALETGKVPGWVKYVPHATTALSAVGAYALGRTRATMKERREEASRRAQEKQAGVEPAPQSRRIPRRKSDDPWRYDHRPAGIFGP